MLKRVFDIIFSVCGLMFFMPFFSIIGLLIKLDSSGPVFYKGLRTGRYGKPFYIFKFRSMAMNAEKQGGDTTVYKDPRITKIGAFLRKYKIDEIPQLLSVLKGDMSIVGPRPELLAYTEKYANSEKCILEVRPGITDFSSIEFSSLDELVGSVDADRVFEEKILPIKNRLRVKYVREQSFLSDMKIIFKTLGILFQKFFKH